MENVEKEALHRFAVINNLGIIFWDSDDPSECWDAYLLFGEEYCKGVYDFLQGFYIDLVDIVDIIGCQLHDPNV